MPYSMVFSEEPSYLLCISNGEVEGVEEYIAWGMEFLSKAKETGHTRVLIDNRTFILHLSSLDIVMFAEKYEELGVPQLGLRFAVLSCSKNEEVSRLIETTLRNRSATYQRFDSKEDAEKWLLEQEGVKKSHH